MRAAIGVAVFTCLFRIEILHNSHGATLKPKPGELVGSLIKIRDTEAGITRWVEVGEVSEQIGPPLTQNGTERSFQIFEQSEEPTGAQPGDFWITEE